MRRIPWDALVDFGTRLLVAKGVPEANARVISALAVETEAYGIPTHGMRVFSYFERMLGTEIDPQAEPLVVREKGATALIDGHRAFGQLAMRLASQIAVRKAREHGIAMVGVRDSFWIAGLAVYMIPLAEAGFLAELWVQHSSGRDCAPFGGIEPRFSTNPVAFAFPTDQAPMISDFSTSIIAMAKVGRMIRKGEKADEELFLDSSGNLTNDPGVMREGGTMLFTGGATQGYKGFAMSLWCEALAAMAGGRCNAPDAPSRQSFTLTVIDPEAFTGKEAYRKEIKRFIAHVKSSRLRPGVTEIRVPGERGLTSRAEARRKGVPIDEEMVASLNAIAEKNGVDGFG